MTELDQFVGGNSQSQSSSIPQTNICWIRSGEIKYVLQLRDTMTNNEWIDWLSIRKSDCQNGGVGLFAERQFPAKSCVGVWCGELVWRHNVAGEHVPDDVLENKLNVKITEDDLLFFDNNCLYTLMKPSLDWVNNERMRLFMGLHFMSRTCSSNCCVENNGLYLTMEKIDKDQELYYGYDNSIEAKPMSVLPSKQKGSLEDTDTDDDTNDKKEAPAKRVCVTKFT